MPAPPLSCASLHATAVSAAASKIFPLPSPVRLGACAVVDLLEHARHREDEVGLELAERRNEVRDVARVPQRCTGIERRDADCASENVRERQEHQSANARSLEQRAEVGVEDALRLGNQVGVRQLAALGSARGARRVDQGRGIGCLQCSDAGVDVLVGDVGAQCGQFLDNTFTACRGIDLVHRAQRGGGCSDVLHGRGMCVVLDDEVDCFGVLENPANLLGCGGFVDRNRHAAGRPDGVVDERPFEASRRHEADAIALLDSDRDQALGDGSHLSGEIACSDIDPCISDFALVDNRRRLRLREGEDRVDRGGILGNGERLGCAELRHEIPPTLRNTDE